MYCHGPSGQLLLVGAQDDARLSYGNAARSWMRLRDHSLHVRRNRARLEPLTRSRVASINQAACKFSASKDQAASGAMYDHVTARQVYVEIQK